MQFNRIGTASTPVCSAWMVHPASPVAMSVPSALALRVSMSDMVALFFAGTKGLFVCLPPEGAAMAVSKRLRFEVLKRDRHKCRYCGRGADEVALTVDHVIPVALGGTDTADNLTACCNQCNGGKSSTSPDAAVVADVSEAAVQWSAAMRQAAEENKLHDNTEVYEAVVKAWTSFRRNQIPDDYRETIDQFLNAGLPAEDIVAMARVADAKPSIYNRWSYFCGCCWTRIRQLQERATEILAGIPPTDPPVTKWTREELISYSESAVNDIKAEWPEYEIDEDRECVHGRLRDCNDLVCLALQHTSALTWAWGRRQFGEEVSELLAELAQKHKADADG